MTTTVHVLFLCVANSARSQMAEGLARRIFPSWVRVSSAGSEPGKLNPFAVKALGEVGIDISSHYSKSVNDIDHNSINIVITLCAEEVCPMFPGKVEKIHWGLPDPASANGSDNEKLAKFREIRDELDQRLRDFSKRFSHANTTQHDEIRQAVRANYAKVAESSGCGCGPSCCSPATTSTAALASVRLGYSEADVQEVPEGANMGLGCGNPQAIASLRPGETVLDLGCGGGFDCFLAARQIGETGRVIGVDMTPEMVSKARANTVKAGFANVDIRLGEIENLPVADSSVDVIISNCVINLSPDKKRVFTEAFRVLKEGGRLAISDVIADAPIPEATKKDLALHAGCIAGAATRDEILSILKEVGFDEVQVIPKMESKTFIKDWAPGSGADNFIVSADIQARKRRC